MSTVGKVLSILVILLAIAWIVLSAGVTELNRSAAAAVEKKKAEAIKLAEDVHGLAVSIQQEKDKTDTQQVATQDMLTAIQARQADKEKERSQILQIAHRFKLQAQGGDSSETAAKKLNEERLAEKTAETEAKAAEEKVVAKLMSENDDLFKRLAELRENFKTTLAENKALVDRLGKSTKGSSAGAYTPARPASFSPR
jgi:hypothetical protein